MCKTCSPRKWSYLWNRWDYKLQIFCGWSQDSNLKSLFSEGYCQMMRSVSADVGKSAEIGGNPPELFSGFTVRPKLVWLPVMGEEVMQYNSSDKLFLLFALFIHQCSTSFSISKLYIIFFKNQYAILGHIYAILLHWGDHLCKGPLHNVSRHFEEVQMCMGANL